jgi:ribonuclease D
METVNEQKLSDLKQIERKAREILFSVSTLLTEENLKPQNPDVRRRIELLKIWRQKKAIELEMQPFMILANRTIIAVATLEPKSLEELGLVSGIGLKKLEAYGKEIMEIIAPDTKPSETLPSMGYIPLA